MSACPATHAHARGSALVEAHEPLAGAYAARATVAGEQWGATEPPPLLLVGAEQDVPLELLLAALVAAAGPDCNMEDLYMQRPTDCLFPLRVLHGGSPAPPELVER